MNLQTYRRTPDLPYRLESLQSGMRGNDTGTSSSGFGLTMDATPLTAATTTAANISDFCPSTSSLGYFGQSSIFKNDENKNCCGICLTAYKSPRILSCNHIFCRLCLIKLADKEQDAAEELVSLACPLCRKEIDLSNGGIDKLPMYFEDDDDNEDSDGDDNDYDEDDDGGKDDGNEYCNEDADADNDNKDANDVDKDQRDLCVVCENSVPAEYECFQCQKVLCDSCKKIHDNLLKHDVQDLKLDLTQAQDKCLKHPEVKVGYLCIDCDSTVCKKCVKSEHSLHQTQTFKSYLIEIDGELGNYFSNITKKLETVVISKVMFSYDTESKVVSNIKKVKILGEDFKIELEKASQAENKKQDKDKTLLNRINFMGKRIKKSKRQRKFTRHLISEIKELQAKIRTHKQFYLPNAVDDIINNQIGTMDIQMGRLFVFQLTKFGNGLNFFFGNLNWTLSTSAGSSISLTPFRKPEDTQLIESITTTVTLSVEGGAQDFTILKTFTKIFQSEDQLKWEFKYPCTMISCVKVLFQNTNIKHRAAVE